MVWSILIFLIILVVLKGIFNTTIRDNPNSGYKETQNRLKNIIQIQKDSGVYVGISDIDHMAHGIFFLGNEVGYIRRGNWPRQNNNGLFKDIIETLHKKRLEISTLGRLEKYPLGTYNRDKNVFTFALEENNYKPGDEYLEQVNTIYLHFEVEIIAPSILKVSIEQIYFNGNNNLQPKKQLCAGTILEYQDRFMDVITDNTSSWGDEASSSINQALNNQEEHKTRTVQKDAGLYIAILDGIHRRPVGMYFTNDKIYFIEGLLDYETREDILVDEMIEAVDCLKINFLEQPLHGYFEVNGDYKYEYFCYVWPFEYHYNFGITIDTRHYDDGNGGLDILQYCNYDITVSIVDNLTLQLMIDKIIYTEPFIDERFSKAFVADGKLFNFYKFI